jgi:hypothetical protein
LLPVTVNVYVPVGVVVPTDIVMVDKPDVVIEEGEKEAVALAGKPLTLKLTLPLNPLSGAALTV